MMSEATETMATTKVEKIWAWHEIKAIRKKLGMTLKEMGEACGVGLRQVQFWESGDSKPSGASAILIAQLAQKVAALGPGDEGTRSGDRRRQIEEETESHTSGPRVQGATVNTAKLTEDIVKKARTLWDKGMTVPEIAKKLKLEVTKAALHMAVTGKTWKHVT